MGYVIWFLLNRFGDVVSVRWERVAIGDSNLFERVSDGMYLSIRDWMHDEPCGDKVLADNPFFRKAYSQIRADIDKR